MQTLASISSPFWTGHAGRRLHPAGVDAVGCAFNDGGRAGETTRVEKDAGASSFEQRLAAFIVERERRGGPAAESEEVVQLLRAVAFRDGEEFACEMLDLARQAGDYDIADFDVYREVASTTLSV